MVWNFQGAKIWWLTLVQNWGTLICYYSEYPQSKYFCEIKILFAMNQIQKLPNLNLWKNSEKKNNVQRSFFSLMCRMTLTLTHTHTYHHYHHVVPLARISLTLSRHFSLSFIASCRFSGLHPISSHSCWMYVRAGRPAFARLYAGSIGVHHLWARPCFSSSVLHVWFV